MPNVIEQKHLIVRLAGGLGNQMFQYALGLALVHRGARVEYDLSWFDGIRDKNVTPRAFELSQAFNLTPPIADPKLTKHWSDSRMGLLRRAWVRVAGRKRTHVCEQDFGGFGYHPEIWSIHCGYLDGYWQSPDYMAGAEDTIRQRLIFPEIVDEANRQYLQTIQRVQAVAVHVRRGDYLRDSSGHAPLPISYYRAAIDILRERVEQPVFFVFSDDGPWARDNLRLGDAVFVHGNEGSAAFRDMQLMSLCRHLICANSSFSWWAAWLHPQPGRQVVIPDDYAQPGKRFVDGWIRLDAGKAVRSQV